MKAVEINGNIKTFGTLPKSWDSNGTTILNFNKLSDIDAQAYGFYDVVQPTYDSRIEELKNLHLDREVYTYDVIEKPIKETLAELKANKIAQLKRMIGSKLSVTDWYIIREADSGEAAPSEIKGERAALRTQSDSIEAEINALTTKKSVVLFDINL